uniref:Uncharacterized protein n=1 Tax=Candidatus Kentrum sp. MB TaxID=2138164 RepID=A0A450X7T0_9GAMM|nr:MAG: hypothetical protein BECKMB1821G_GA0114241_101316 [Candidatus Kentron sp. MB]
MPPALECGEHSRQSYRIQSQSQSRSPSHGLLSELIRLPSRGGNRITKKRKIIKRFRFFDTGLRNTSKVTEDFMLQAKQEVPQLFDFDPESLCEQTLDRNQTALVFTSYCLLLLCQTSGNQPDLPDLFR